MEMLKSSNVDFYRKANLFRNILVANTVPGMKSYIMVSV